MKDEIVKEKLLFVAPLISFVILPVVYRIIYGTISYYSLSTLLRYINYIGNITSAISLGTLVYFILRKDRRFVLFYTCIYTAGYLLSIVMYLSMYRDSLLYTLVGLSEYLIIWVIIDLVSKQIRRENIKPVLLLAIGVVLKLFVLQCLARFDVIVNFTFQTFLFIAITFATGFLIFWKRDGISIVEFSGRQTVRTQPTQHVKTQNPSSNTNSAEQAQSEDRYLFCPNCGNELSDEDIFCATCGYKTR